MSLRDEEALKHQKVKTSKIKKLIIVLIIILTILGISIVALIMYQMSHSTKIKTYIDGVSISNFDEILDFETDENGKTQIYVPIRTFASYLNAINEEFGYQTFKGDYNPKTEEDDKCYIIRNDYEVCLYTKKSKVLYKLNLQNKSNEYEECYIGKDVFENNGQLYTSIEGIEKGYNVSFTYDEQKKEIKIFTLDKIVEAHQAELEKKSVGNYGILSIESNSYADSKCVFENLLIVQSTSNEKFGIVHADDYTSFVLEPQYDNISYMSEYAAFLVESNGKVGLFSKDGKRKINLIYDKITPMGQNSNLCLVQSNNTYGVVDENGKIIIHPEYDAIGIDISLYSYNGIKNGFILLNNLIPVCQNEKWAFFDTKGKMITNGFIYTDIGCSNQRNVNNVYPLLMIPDYNVIVVRDDYGKFGVMNGNGNDAILQFLFDNMYIKVSEGKSSYHMTYKEKEYEISQYLDKVVKNRK